MARIIFTGGHHNSALSVAVALQKLGHDVLWYGHKYSMTQDKSVTAEYQEVQAHNITFRELMAGKVYKTLNILQLLRVPFGFLQAYIFLIQDRPDLIVSFGGYLAAPVVLAGWIMGVPIVTHEQTTAIGLSNKFIALFANKIFITWPQSKKYFKQDKVVLTGLPLRPAIFERRAEKAFFARKRLPIIYITGGKQGSHVMNDSFRQILPELLTRACVVHQCGANTVYDDFNKLEKESETLSPQLQKRYILRKYIFEDEIGEVFHSSDLVVSRAGAHTTYELAALGKPSLLIPIPWASHNEQYKNARLLVNEGLSVLLPEDQLTPKKLLQDIIRMLDHLDQYQQQAESAKSRIIFDATDRIVHEIESIIAQENG